MVEDFSINLVRSIYTKVIGKNLRDTLYIYIYIYKILSILVLFASRTGSKIKCKCFINIRNGVKIVKIKNAMGENLAKKNSIGHYTKERFYQIL